MVAGVVATAAGLVGASAFVTGTEAVASTDWSLEATAASLVTVVPPVPDIGIASAPGGLGSNAGGLVTSKLGCWHVAPVSGYTQRFCRSAVMNCLTRSSEAESTFS